MKQADVAPGAWREYEIPEKGRYVELEKTVPYDYRSIMHYGKYAAIRRDARVRRFRSMTCTKIQGRTASKVSGPSKSIASPTAFSVR